MRYCASSWVLIAILLTSGNAPAARLAVDLPPGSMVGIYPVLSPMFRERPLYTSRPDRLLCGMLVTVDTFHFYSRLSEERGVDGHCPQFESAKILPRLFTGILCFDGAVYAVRSNPDGYDACFVSTRTAPGWAGYWLMAK